MTDSLAKGSRQRTPEEKAARHHGVRVTIWRAVHEAHRSGEHVMVQWWNRSHHGHITEISEDGFRVKDYAGSSPWCSWEGTKEVREPYWDVEAELDRIYPEPCRGCIAFFKGRQAA
jgi:hypothetical protein